MCKKKAEGAGAFLSVKNLFSQATLNTLLNNDDILWGKGVNTC
ncbi:hypothetical protein D920_00608 [Enterococcus faecalis 13-SD-W-01]|jgi:hypothetical protein|nr:hypothetical protein D920_00608 [Enterococcus faecalis 13-SD-W-01]